MLELEKLEDSEIMDLVYNSVNFEEATGDVLSSLYAYGAIVDLGIKLNYEQRLFLEELLKENL